MKHTFTIAGMTCNHCVAKVADQLSTIEGVTQVEVNLEYGEAEIGMKNTIPIEVFKSAISQQYQIGEKIVNQSEIVAETSNEKSKLQLLKPLFLILTFLFSATFLMHFQQWNTTEAMLDFMGLFYVVFSFFKFLDLKGFPESFRMYDPLAKLVPGYAWVYPFIELALGVLFLMRLQIDMALVITLFILGSTTIGVIKTLVDKKSIRCACLGTALKLPMTEATLIENSIMLIMAIAMLIGIY